MAVLVATLLMASGVGRADHAATSNEAATARALDPVDLGYPSRRPLTAIFRGPRGTSLEFTSFSGSDEQIIRVTATEPGIWHYRVSAGAETISSGELRVADAGLSGFIRPRGHSLVYPDGSPFVAIGENRINIYDRKWNWDELSIDAYLEHMAKSGMTVLRVFIVMDVENEQTGGANLGVLEPELGRFDEHVATMFDELFRSAQSRGIYVVLVAFALGFSVNDDWKSWQDNPYSAERGGPARSPVDFFESPAARERAAERIRYLAARYGAFPNLLAIDLINEPEWDGAIPEVSWAPWAEAMAHEWDRADPYGHAVTVGSVGLHWNIEGDERAWWSSDACAIVQWHLYGPEVYDVHALAAEMTRKVRETWSYGKPVLVGEFAYGGEAKPEYDHTHVGLWSAALSGASVLAHSAPPFNVDSDEPMTPERARHFRVLRDVLSGLRDARPAEARPTGDALAWSLLGARRGAVWLLAPRAEYGSFVSGERVSVWPATQGRWHVEWRDDVTGVVLIESDVQTRGDRLELSAPPFSRHVVAELTWQ